MKHPINVRNYEECTGEAYRVQFNAERTRDPGVSLNPAFSFL